MRSVLNSWPATPLSENIKFCAQILREMLEQRAFESFRVSTMDARSRFSELAAIARDVEAERIPSVTMKPAIEEISFHFRSDEIIRRRHRDLSKLFDLHTAKIPSKQEASKFRRLLYMGYKDLNENYRKELDAALELELQGSADRDKLKQLLNAYMSVLINLGYSRQYLRRQVVSRFFSDDIKRLHPRTLNSFLAKFDGKARSHVATVQVSQHAGDYLNSLAVPGLTVSDYSGLTADAKGAFTTASSTSLSYVSIGTEAPDPYEALDNALIALRTLEAMATISGRSLRFKLPERGYVRQSKRSTGERIKLTPLVLSRYTSTVTPGIASEVGRYTKAILKNFNVQSMERTFSSINMAALSRTSNRPENGLIALWSAIEVLLADPPAGVPRIVYYVDSLAPCVCSTYFRRYTGAVLDALQRYEKAHTKAALASLALDQTADPRSRFIQLMFDPALASEKFNFVNAISANPVAQFRLDKLRSNFATRGDFSNSLRAHEDRVRWQLFRIYRTRNNIIHGGKLPSYLAPLVMNVSEYFTSAAEAIVNKGNEGTSSSHIGQMVSEVGFDYEMTKLRLKENNPTVPIPLEELLKLAKQ